MQKRFQDRARIKAKRYTNLYIKRRLIQLEIDIIGTISEGLLSHLPKRKILQTIKIQIKTVCTALELSATEQDHVWLNAYNLYLRISKKTFSAMRKNKDGDKREAVYLAVRNHIMQNDLVKQANQVMYQYEYRQKHDTIYGKKGIIAQARENASDSEKSTAKKYSPFFLCSSHPKPAKDHELWEGKMYYDEEWKKYVPASDPNFARIEAYIRNRKLNSIQWVVGPPVYLMTRRNCKHYFKNIPLEDVMHGSPRSLLKKNKMLMKESDQPASPEKLTYRNYYNRLKTEEMLYEVLPNEKLKKDLKKDRILLDKYKKILDNKDGH